MRDAAGLDPGFREAVRQGLIRGPRLFLSVTPLSQSGGGTRVQGVGPAQALKGRELAIKSEVLGPMGAIVSATRTNAELLNAADRLGTVEPGKLADLIVTAENPIDHIGLFEDGLKNVVMVIQGGTEVKDRLG